jgi:hypothetical protein
MLVGLEPQLGDKSGAPRHFDASREALFVATLPFFCDKTDATGHSARNRKTMYL